MQAKIEKYGSMGVRGATPPAMGVKYANEMASPLWQRILNRTPIW